MFHDIRIAGTDVRFRCAPGQTVLNAALASGVEIPYSCRRGICGSCAGSVVAGRFEHGASVNAPQDKHLLCQVLPRENLVISPSHWARRDGAAPRRMQVQVFRNDSPAAGVSILQLRLPAGQRTKFKAGQYLEVILPDGERRAYSMANAPHQSDCLQLHVRHLPGGRFTEVVRGLAAGANLDVELPFGSFSLSASQRPMLCVATGTGFSPIQSILDHMARQQTHRHVTLVWGGRDRHGLYLPAAVERWKKLWPDFRFLAAIEDPSDAAAAGAFCGRVDAAVRSLALDLTEHEVYCCGVPLMVAAVRNLCVDVLGLDAGRFHSDAFTSPQPQES